MKGSDKIGMTINIGGELIKLDVDFDEQNSVRDTERAIKLYLERLKKDWPGNSDRNLLAIATYQFARSYHKLLKINEDAMEIINRNVDLIDRQLKSEDPANTEILSF